MNEEVVQSLLDLAKAQEERIDTLERHLVETMSDARALSLAAVLLMHASGEEVRDIVQSAARDMMDREPEAFAPVLRQSFKSMLNLDV